MQDSPIFEEDQEEHDLTNGYVEEEDHLMMLESQPAAIYA